MQPILFALISYLTWGTGVFFEAIAARRLQSHSLALWSFVFSTLVLTFYAPFVLKDLEGLTVNLLLIIIGGAVGGLFLGTIVYYEALKRGNRALVGTIASSFPAIAVLVSILFLNEKVSIQQIVAIAVIFVGLLLSSVDMRELRRKNIFSDKGTLLAFIPMFSWGIWIAVWKIPVSQIGWFWPNYIAFLLFPLIFFYMKMKKIGLERPTLNQALVPLIVSTVLVRIAEFSYNLGISKGLVAIVAPIAGANPTLFVLLAFLFFKDRITKQQIAGIITTLTGIVLLSFLS